MSAVTEISSIVMQGTDGDFRLSSRRPSVRLRHVTMLLALPLVGSACTWWQAKPMAVPDSPPAECADWNTFYFNQAATIEDISACLAAGADPNAESETGWTPLHFAAANKDLAVIQALMAAGADPKARNYGGRGVTPLELAVRFNDNATVFQALMAADPATGSSHDWQLLHTAGYGTAAELRMLLDTGGDPTSGNPAAGHFCTWPLATMMRPSRTHFSPPEPIPQPRTSSAGHPCTSPHRPTRTSP